MFITVVVIVIAFIFAIASAAAHAYVNNDTIRNYIVNYFKSLTLKENAIEILLSALEVLADTNITWCGEYAIYSLAKEENIKKAFVSTKWSGLFKFTFVPLTNGEKGMLFIERKYNEFLPVLFARKVKSYRALRYTTKSATEVVKEYVVKHYNLDVEVVKNYHNEEVLVIGYNESDKYLIKLLNRLKRTELDQFFNVFVIRNQMYVYKKECLPSFLRFVLSK